MGSGMNLPQMPPDKANHLWVGAVIFNVTFFIAHFSFPAHQFVIACAFTFFMAIGKEISDAVINWRATGKLTQGPHGVEFLDAAATCFGGILAALPLIVLRA